MGCCPRGSSVRGFLQARILEWVAISSSRGSSWSRDRTCISRVSCIGRRDFFLLPLSRLWSPDTCICITESLFYAPETSTTLLNNHERKKVKVAQSCPTLWDPMDCIVHGILQARILEWVVFPFSRGSSQLRDQTQVSSIAGGFFTSWATREAQEHRRGWPIPSPVNLPDPGIEPESPALLEDSLPTELWGKPIKQPYSNIK